MNSLILLNPMKIFPTHKCGLYLTHNEHKNYYETVKEFIVNQDIELTEDEYDKCVINDELWVLQWYPDTPIGSYTVAGSTLEYVLEKANHENFA
jgi:hypothetical protein